MKLKTLHLFSLNRFCKINFLIVIFLSLGSIPAKAFSQDNPGIVESLERLVEVHKKQYAQNKSKIQSNLNALSDISSLKEIKLDPQFMRSLIAHSEDKYLRLAQKDECKFLSAMENNLLRTTEGEVTSVLINFKNSQNKIESASLPVADFFAQIYKKQCLNNREFATLFSESNFQKTIEGIRFSVPKNEIACLNVHKEWLENPFTSYLCNINQVIKKSKEERLVELYKSKIATMQKTYIDNLCNNLTSPEHFCENYLKSDVWSKVINGEIPLYKMSYKCQNMMGKTTDLTINDLKNCGAKLISQPAFCETKGTTDYRSNFPLQSCDNISDALKKSKLVTNYHDCPGNVDNEAITNIHRLVNHFAPRKIISNPQTCSGEANYTFARLNLAIKNEQGWPLKICYMNRITNKEACAPYIPGSREDEPLSEDQVIAKILYQQKGAPAETKCRIVDAKTYSPLRSEFKFGCFIVYDQENCTTLNCNKRVIWEDSALTDIKFLGLPIFDYFPNAYISERFSFENMIDEVYGTQGRSIKNLTDMKFFLDTIPNGVIHGVGCVEDLIPEEFQKTTMNQCHPMPFIIDAHVLKNKVTWLVFRAAIDDLHTPRLVLWQNIFNAVSAYRELHPLTTWTLYGIKK